MRSPTYLRVAVAAGALALVTACVKIPGEIEAQFAPAQPYETNNFRRRSDAPSPLGFVTENDLAPIAPATDAGAGDAGAGDAGDPDAASADGGLQNAMRRLGELSATSTHGSAAGDGGAAAAPTAADAAAPSPKSDGGAP